MGMLERIAISIADNDPNGVQWVQRDDLGKRQARWSARGVLLQMLKPTDAMCRAGSSILSNFDDGSGGSIKPDDEDAGKSFTAMIKIALSEELDGKSE